MFDWRCFATRDKDCHADFHGLLQVKKEELKEKQLLEQYKKYQNSFDKKIAQIHL